MKYDLRLLVVPGVNAKGRQVGGFESRADARRESRQRLRCLRAPETTNLRQILKRCWAQSRCGSLACPHCSRFRRVEFGNAVLKFLASYPISDLRFVTLVNPSDALPARDLHSFNPKALVARTRRQFERAGIEKDSAFLIGCVDGEWDAGWGVFQPHLHLIAWNLNTDLLNELVEKWSREPLRVRVRKRCEPIAHQDLPRAVCYLDKAFWPSVARSKNPNGIHPYPGRRPPPDIEAEVLSWLHVQEPGDLRFFFGAKLYGRRISKT